MLFIASHCGIGFPIASPYQAPAAWVPGTTGWALADLSESTTLVTDLFVDVFLAGFAPGTTLFTAPFLATIELHRSVTSPCSFGTQGCHVPCNLQGISERSDRPPVLPLK